MKSSAWGFLWDQAYKNMQAYIAPDSIFLLRILLGILAAKFPVNVNKPKQLLCMRQTERYTNRQRAMLTPYGAGNHQDSASRIGCLWVVGFNGTFNTPKLFILAN